MKRLVPSFTFLAGLILACSRDGPVDPIAQPDEVAAAAARVGGPRLDPGAVNIADMLTDPLFVALVDDIEDPTLSKPLLAAVAALRSGQLDKATDFFGIAKARAAVLGEGAPSETLILWSAIELYLDEAEPTWGHAPVRLDHPTPLAKGTSK